MGDSLLNKVCAVVVTYHPEMEALKQQFTELQSQLDFIIIVDNGSSKEFVSEIKDLVSEHKRAQLISLPENKGIAYAQNKGILRAKEGECGYVLLMDQDSIPDTDMVAKLMYSYFEKMSLGFKVAAIGPRFVDSDTGRLTDHVKLGTLSIARALCKPKDSTVEVDFLIASGSLISMAVLDDVGLMDADLFIDHVDTEWCFRAKSQGYIVLGHCNAKMTHSLGESRARIWFGKWREVPIHKPFRYFYIFRNSIRLYKRSYMPLHWKIVDTVRLMQTIIFMGLFTPNRIAKLKMMFKGMLFGFLNRNK
jgi:rhamnosyltransferase